MRFFLLIFFSFSALYCFAQQQVGYAVFYAQYFQGKQTANGEFYDSAKYTAATKAFPFGSVLRVSVLDENGRKTGQSVEVRVNDRGPYAKECPECIIDLSWIAADKIGLTRKGKCPVHIERIDNKSSFSSKPKGQILSYSQKQAKTVESGFGSSSNEEKRVLSRRGMAAAAEEEWANESEVSEPLGYSSTDMPLRRKSLQTYENQNTDNQEYRVFGYTSASSVPQAKKTELNWNSSPMQGYGIQLASYVDRTNASRFFSELQRSGLKGLYIREAVNDIGKTHFRIILGQYLKKSDADIALADLEKNTRYRGLVVLLSK